MYDPMRDLIAELIADPNVSTDRIRRFEPAPGDEQSAGEYLKFVVLVRVAGDREPGRVPVQHVSVVARCYAATDYEATQLAGEIVDSIHNRGPRIGLGLIYRSTAGSDGGTEKDPDTGQPYLEQTLTLHAATAAVA